MFGVRRDVTLQLPITQILDMKGCVITAFRSHPHVTQMWRENFLDLILTSPRCGKLNLLTSLFHFFLKQFSPVLLKQAV